MFRPKKPTKAIAPKTSVPALSHASASDMFLHEPITLEPLLIAARKEDWKTVDRLINDGYSLRWKDHQTHESIIRLLTKEGCDDAVIVLIRSEATRLNLKPPQFFQHPTMVYLFQEGIESALLNNNTLLIKQIRKFYGELNIPSEMMTSLEERIAIEKGDIKTLKMSQLDMTDKVFYLSRGNQLKAAIALLKDASPANSRLAMLRALAGASQNHRVNLNDYLKKIHKTLKIDDSNPSFASTQIMVASTNGEADNVLAMLRHYQKETPLQLPTLIQENIDVAVNNDDANLVLALCNRLKDTEIPADSYFQIIEGVAITCLDREHYALARTLLHQLPALTIDTLPLNLQHLPKGKIHRLFQQVRDPAICLDIALKGPPSWLALLKEEYSLAEMSDEGFQNIIKYPAIALMLYKCCTNEEGELPTEILFNLIKFIPDHDFSSHDIDVFTKELTGAQTDIDDKKKKYHFNRFISPPAKPRGSKDDIACFREIKKSIVSLLSSITPANSGYFSKSSSAHTLQTALQQASNLYQIYALLQKAILNHDKHQHLYQTCLAIYESEPYRHLPAIKEVKERWMKIEAESKRALSK